MSEKLMVTVLNKDFEPVKPIDSLYSLIWNVRYIEIGDFELFIPIETKSFDYFLKGNYLHLKNSDRLMIIEDIEINANQTDGIFLTVTGRSLESILTRRIVWEQTVLTGSLQDAIFKLLDENIINPTLPERKIDNFIFKKSTDTEILSLEVDAQYWGEEIYEAIENLCKVEKIGFKVTLNELNQFVFELYRGVDRSYDQLENPYVVFSPDYDNLRSSSYLESEKLYKNVTLIIGEESGWDFRKTVLEVEGGSGTGIDRREVFTDATSLSSETEEGYLPDDVYMKHLKQKGLETLQENKINKVFEGNMDVSKTFKYEKDFNLGDLVQMKNQQGFEEKTRVSEIIFVQDMEGYNVYPTFVVDEE